MKITQQIFEWVKDDLKLSNHYVVSRAHDLSLKTILQIDMSKSYEQYVNMSRAQHPPVKYSLADDVLALHKKLLNREAKTAREAIRNLLNET